MNPGIVLRPSNKFVVAILVLVCLLILGAVLVHTAVLGPAGQPPWLPLASLLLLLWPVRRWIALRSVRATLAGDHLRVETGLLSKSTRILQLAKVQDVRVNQSLGQRMFGVGDIAIETAGEASRLTLHQFDNPHRIADEILQAAGAHTTQHPL